MNWLEVLLLGVIVQAAWPRADELLAFRCDREFRRAATTLGWRPHYYA